MVTRLELEWSGPPGRIVEVCGDFPDWKQPVAMVEVSAGVYRTSIDVEPGVHRYKLRLDRRDWVLDPRAAIVDRAEGYENGEVIAGGTEPPIHFAPDRRHAVLLEDGRLLVHVEADEHASRPESISVEGAGSIPLVEVGRRAGRVLLRAEATLVPAPDRAAIRIPGERASFEIARRDPVGRPPAWLDRAVFYAIFVDRWHRSDRSPRDPRARPRSAPSTPETFYGGDLDGVTESMSYFADLGVDALVLTPIHTSPSPHRYDPTDLSAVDPALGGEPALRRLLDAAHRRSLKVIVDAAFTHVNESHPAFQSVLLEQDGSPYTSWFRLRRFPVEARNAETFDHYYGCPHLPWLDLSPGPVREHVIESAEALARLGVDGLRLDAMNDAPPDFWRELRARTRAIHPELLLLGEIVSDRPARFAEERGVDCATNFHHREALLSFFARDQIDAAELWSRTQLQLFRSGPFEPGFHLLFLDNHDTARFLSIAKLHDATRLALSYLLIRPEPIWITYGTELGLSSGDAEPNLDDAWSERIPMPALTKSDTRTRALLTQLCRLRRELPALQGPEITPIAAYDKVLVLARGRAPVRLFFAVNAGHNPAALPELPAESVELLSVNAEPDGDPRRPLAPLSARLLLESR